MQSYNDTPFQLKRDHPKRQHLCTGALKDERGKYTIEYRPDFALFHEAIMEAKGKPTIFVTFFGSYQTGKSSAIKMLTGDGEVQIDIGDGMRETTYGAFVYGPYSYNKIRQRFGVEIIPEDDTQIFFVDTEGCNGFKAGRPESAVYLLSQLIAPYASISNVVISTIKAGVTAPEVDSMETMFEIINIIRQGVGVESAHLLGLVPNVTNYFPENFVEKQKQITETMQEKFDDFQFGSFKFDEFIPLPIFDTDHDILEQNERFNNAFCIFAQRLIYHIDTSRQSMLLEAEGIFEMFKVLAARTEEQKLSEVAYEALKETKKSSAWKLSKRTVDKIISGKNEEIKKIVAEFKEKLKNDQIFATPILDKDKIINEALQELDEKLPESTKSEKEVYDEFKSRIQREISTEYKKFGRLIKKIKAKQYTFIKDKIATYINNAKPVIYTNIRNNKSTYEDHILNIVQNEAFTFIKNQFLRESNEICKDVQQRNADIVDDLIAIFEPLKLEEDIKTKVKEHIMKIKSQIRNDFFLQVKAIVENNKQSQIREFSNYALNFINSKTSNLRSKLENGNLEVAEINIHSDFRQIENECKRSLLRMYTDNTNQEIIGQVEANISTYLMKSLNNFKECIQEAKRVEMQKQLLKQTLAKTMSNRINELKQKVKSSSATDPNDIIPKNSFENIEKECYQEINKAFPDGKENKELMKYLNNEIISKNKNEMEAIENLKQTTVQQNIKNIVNNLQNKAKYLVDHIYYELTSSCRNDKNCVDITCIKFNNKFTGSIETFNFETTDNKFKDYIIRRWNRKINKVSIPNESKASVNSYFKDYLKRKLNEAQDTIKNIISINEYNIIKKNKIEIDEEMEQIKRQCTSIICNSDSADASEIVNGFSNEFKRECNNIKEKINSIPSENIKNQLNDYLAGQIQKCSNQLMKEAEEKAKNASWWRKAVNILGKIWDKIKGFFGF